MTVAVVGNVSQLLSQAKKTTNGRGQVSYYIGHDKSIWSGHREDLVRTKCKKSAIDFLKE